MKALSEIFVSLRKGRGDKDELFERAQRLFEAGRYEESTKWFTSALNAGYDPGIVHVSRGVSWLMARQIQRAVEDFGSALRVNARDASACYYRGTAHILREDYGRAESDFTGALEINPEHRAAMFARGLCCFHLGRREEAACDLRQALGNGLSAIYGVADTYDWKQRVGEVIELLEGARRSRVVEITDTEMNTLRDWLRAA
ncbi:MAG: tetratricopeptide repeat protein [Nitrospiraceae bacterium]|nr:tetratricopeptide repeat protein [Nitrospiraceae bacterium]